MADPQTNTTAAETGAAPQRPLRRRRDGRLVAGVAAGIGDHLGVDPVIVRILFVVTTIFTNGLGLIAYVLGWIFIPKAEPGELPPAPPGGERRSGGDPMFWVGIGLLIVGALWLLGGPFGPVRWFPDLFAPGLVWPLVLILFGVALWRSSDRPVADPSTPAPPPPPVGGAPWVPPDEPGPGTAAGPRPAVTPAGPPPITEPDTTRDDMTVTDAGTPPTDADTGVTDTGGPATGPGGPSTDPGGPGAVPPAPPAGGPGGEGPAWTPPPVPRRESSILGRITIGVALLAAGVPWLLSLAGVLAAGPGQIAAAALLVVGVGLLVGSVAGRARWLIVVGLLLAPVVIAAELFRPLGLTDVPRWLLRGPVGEVVLSPASAEELESSYQLGAGQLLLDLRDVELDEDTRVGVQVGAGEVRIAVPEDVSVDLRVRTGAGEATLFGQRTSGVGIDRTVRDEGPADVTLELDVQVGFGPVRVDRDLAFAPSGPRPPFVERSDHVPPVPALAPAA